MKQRKGKAASDAPEKDAPEKEKPSEIATSQPGILSVQSVLCTLIVGVIGAACFYNR